MAWVKHHDKYEDAPANRAKLNVATEKSGCDCH
jgi:hypothetical protein